MTKPYQPWQPITDTKDLKCLGKLGEESGELSQIICRIIIQGLDGLDPHTGISNRLWLEKEIADVTGNIQLVVERFELDEDFILARAADKYKRIKDWQENM